MPNPKNPKEIPDPNDPEKLIPNPDYIPDDDDGDDDDNKDDKDKQLSDAEKAAKALEDAKAAFKAKMDAAYKARDEALDKVKEFEDKERAAEIQRLKDAGEHEKAHAAEMAEKDAIIRSLTETNTKLTRDIEVSNVLNAYEFRNERAKELAKRDIVSELVKNDDGVWVHKDGTSIKEFVKVFAGLDENSFMFKPKNSNGLGNDTTPTPTPNRKKSLFEMSQADVIKLAAEGKL